MEATTWRWDLGEARSFSVWCNATFLLRSQAEVLEDANVKGTWGELGREVGGGRLHGDGAQTTA